MQEEVDVVSSKHSKGNNWRKEEYTEGGDIGGEMVVGGGGGGIVGGKNGLGCK